MNQQPALLEEYRKGETATFVTATMLDEKQTLSDWKK